MSFFPKKMSQNDWATIMPFGPVILIFYWPKKKFFRASQRLALISGTVVYKIIQLVGSNFIEKVI
jgi:hypothetical protein